MPFGLRSLLREFKNKIETQIGILVALTGYCLFARENRGLSVKDFKSKYLELRKCEELLAIAKAHQKHEKKMSSKSHADPIALSFNETCLRMSDVSLLQGPRWLNDQILSFYFEYLERVRYKTNSDLLFVAPEVTQCMKLMDDGELETLLNQLQAPRKPFIFFALNDNESSRAGGTHWSLLVFSRPEKTFFHFDSWGNSNNQTSHDFVQRIKDALNCRQCQMKPIRCLQQVNGYDCGIHVICMTDNIADYVNRYECVEGVGPLHMDTISAKRMELLKLIQSLGGKI